MRVSMAVSMVRAASLAAAFLLVAPGGAAAAETPLGTVLPVYTIVPFATLLLAIALLPLSVPHFWEKNSNKAVVAAVLAVPVAVYLVAVHGADGFAEIVHVLRDYASFLILLFALFVITSGIFVRGSLSGTPLMNATFLAIGAVIASFIGTTGASVLLVRPLLRANERRVAKAHIVVFFIFVASNCGGLLTPLGDPPLFLGFLNGVPFDWTFRLWREWLFVNGVLLVVFFAWDTLALRREEVERHRPELDQELEHHAPLAIDGLHNFAFLAAIIAIIYASGRGLGTGGEAWAFGRQEGLMLLAAAASYVTTAAENRERNNFSFAPIVEVAILFAGIFVTMGPALLILNARGAELGLREPWHFFWASGSLSSFLDNAPTYLTFAATAAGLKHVAAEGRYLAEFLRAGPEAEALLAAVSVGSVCMGANSYIGNGPNFMVKAIAEENGVAMPSFFGYMAYSVGILVPIFVVMTFVFF